MNLCEFQEKVFGTSPNEAQTRFYAQTNTGICGYFEDSTFNEDRFLAVLTFAFWQALPFGTGAYHPVMLIVPPAHKAQVLVCVKETTKYLLERFVESQGMYDLVCNVVKSFQLGSNILGLTEAPKRWVSYGFHNNAPLPAWMQGRILP